MIIEGIVTTLNSQSEVNIAPMGPIVDENFSKLILRPFQTSTTYQNLKQHGQGIFHITDNVMMIAQGAIGKISPLPELLDATDVRGKILKDACRWYAFEVRSLDDTQERTHIEVEVIAAGKQRDFLGFNRAKHAVIEAAIFATRLHILDAEIIRAEFEKLKVIVEKTAGDQEFAAFAMLEGYVQSHLEQQS